MTKIVNKTSRKNVMRILEERYLFPGPCDNLVSDDGLSFNSREVDGFCEKDSVQNMTLSPCRLGNNELQRFIRPFEESMRRHGEG